jgi:hypothetical protein
MLLLHEAKISIAKTIKVRGYCMAHIIKTFIWHNILLSVKGFLKVLLRLLPNSQFFLKPRVLRFIENL